MCCNMFHQVSTIGSILVYQILMQFSTIDNVINVIQKESLNIQNPNVLCTCNARISKTSVRNWAGSLQANNCSRLTIIYSGRESKSHIFIIYFTFFCHFIIFHIFHYYILYIVFYQSVASSYHTRVVVFAGEPRGGKHMLQPLFVTIYDFKCSFNLKFINSTQYFN